MIQMQAGVRYDMPANFGPSIMPDTSVTGHQLVAGIGFETEPDALAAILPSHFRPAREPIVQVTAHPVRGVDWLHGRGYNIVTVSASVVPVDAPDEEGPLSIVAWETDASAIFLGREFLGMPKLWAEIPDIRKDGSSWSFSCSEYGAGLLEVALEDMTPLGEEKVAEMNTAGSPGVLYGWKYIPGPGGEPDADYALRIPLGSATVTSAWSGTGKLEFGSPGPADAPLSSHVIAGLRGLPVVAVKDAFAIERRDATFPRGDIERIG
ncbi:MAG: acetoacetate decarboxylase family protein [Solirubrobacterales bacterium]